MSLNRRQAIQATVAAAAAAVLPGLDAVAKIAAPAPPPTPVLPSPRRMVRVPILVYDSVATACKTGGFVLMTEERYKQFKKSVDDLHDHLCDPQYSLMLK